jgi:predicted enzyme related to lactoylglutathione lyase
MHKSRLGVIVIDCNTDDMDRDAAFWGRALGWQAHPEDKGYTILDAPDNELRVLLQKVDHPSRVHIDIETDDQEAEVKRLEALGAKRVAQIKRWWVMEAPSGHRFCVVTPQRPDFDENANEWD